MKKLLKIEVCGSYKQCMEPTDMTEKSKMAAKKNKRENAKHKRVKRESKPHLRVKLWEKLKNVKHERVKRESKPHFSVKLWEDLLTDEVFGKVARK